MPNGHSRNRNSRHANTQRHIRQGEIISAQSIEIINDVIVEAEAFVDHSAEHRAETLALKKRLDKLEKKERQTSEENREYRRCLNDLDERKIITLTEHSTNMEIEFNGITLKNGKYIEFKDAERDKKLVEGCRKECAFVLEKAVKLCEVKENKSSEPGWKFFKEDDDLVCDINFSDEEDDN